MAVNFPNSSENPVKNSTILSHLNAIRMQHYLCNALKPVLLVYIIYIQIIVINSKTSILWKLNVQSGNIDGFSEGQRHVRTNINVNVIRSTEGKNRNSIEC